MKAAEAATMEAAKPAAVKTGKAATSAETERDDPLSPDREARGGRCARQQRTRQSLSVH
jgi:hypothetical protein